MEACLKKYQHFLPLVDSVYELLGMEVEVTIKRIVIHLATKWQQPYSRRYGYVKRRIAVNLVQSTHWCILGSTMHAHFISVQLPQ